MTLCYICGTMCICKIKDTYPNLIQQAHINLRAYASAGIQYSDTDDFPKHLITFAHGRKYSTWFYHCARMVGNAHHIFRYDHDNYSPDVNCSIDCTCAVKYENKNIIFDDGLTAYMAGRCFRPIFHLAILKHANNIKASELLLPADELLHVVDSEAYILIGKHNEDRKNVKMKITKDSLMNFRNNLLSIGR